MYIVICILSIILISGGLYLILDKKFEKKRIKSAQEKSVNEFFEMILKSGYDKLVNDFKEYNKLAKEDGIVFVGDSLTQNYNVYECYKEYLVYNRGIGGDTTVGLLNRMEESIYALNPKLVVLLIGINDFELVKDSTPETIYNNIKLIVEKIRNNCPNTKIILESLYPVHKSDNPIIDQGSVMRKDNEKINQVNELIKNIPGVHYVNVHDHLLDENNELKIEYTMEGLHINSYGYRFISELLKEEIKKVIKE